MARPQQTRRRPPPPPPIEDMSDKTVHHLHPPKFLKPKLDFDEKPAIVTIRKVTKEPMWSNHANDWEKENVIYFQGYDRGIKGVKMNTDILEEFFGEDIPNWIGKRVKLHHVHENVAGKGHYLTRIAPERVPQTNELPQETPAPPPPPITEQQLEELEGFGAQLYGEEWGEKSVELAQAVSKNAVSSILELTEEQGTRLINGIINKINAEAENGDVPEPMAEPHPANTQPPVGLDDEDEDFQEVYNGK